MSKKIISPIKRFFRLFVLSVVLTYFGLIPLYSQKLAKYSNSSLAEKIYLQLDGKVYTTDKSIWYKAVVTNAFNHVPTTVSSVLYVELIDPNETIVDAKVLKIENGIGEGFFDLKPEYPEGVYLVRAYTKWDKNFGRDFFFREYIHVFAASAGKRANPISEIALLEDQSNKRRINAFLNPESIDSLHKKDLKIAIALDEKKDSLLIRKDKNDRYKLDYEIPEGSRLLTLQMQTHNNKKYTKTIALDQDFLDIQFFPESGELVHGIPTVVGFKALNYIGKGKRVEGEIINQKDEVVAGFKSNQLGMGYFALSNTDSNDTYYAHLLPDLDEETMRLYPLPEVASYGNTLSVKREGDLIDLEVTSNYLKNDSVQIRALCRGMVYYDIKGKLKDGKLSATLPVNYLPEEIIVFTLMTSQLKPLAERLYFNEYPGSRLQVNISANKETFIQREETKLDIITSDNNGEAVNANLSLLVINREQMGKIQDTRQNILSYFLLSSELRGEIENPGFYFNKETDRYRDIDALMLTQGWRKYNYNKIVDTFLYQPEEYLTASGSVSGIFKKKGKKKVDLTIMAFNDTPNFQIRTTDSLGRFSFTVEDAYGQNIEVLIQTTKKSGKKADYSITLDKKEPPAVSFDNRKSIEMVDSVVNLLVQQNVRRKLVDDAFRLSTDAIYIEEVTVTAYRITPERKKVVEEYGIPDIVINGEDIREKEEKWSYGLYSVLMFKYPEQVNITRINGPNGFLYAHLYNSEPTLVVIDGIPVKIWDYSHIPNIPPSEVKSFEIIEYASNFMELFLDAFPYASPANAPITGNVIAIYTYAGTGLNGARKAVGIINKSIPVFSEKREFYAPKYENLSPQDWDKPDFRALLFWDPVIETDSMGKASAEFYNGDNMGEVQVVVEAISENGKIGYGELIYNVEKNSKR